MRHFFLYSKKFGVFGNFGLILCLKCHYIVAKINLKLIGRRRTRKLVTLALKLYQNTQTNVEFGKILRDVIVAVLRSALYDFIVLGLYNAFYTGFV